MSLEQFLAGPWKKSHESYELSAFNIRPAPEFSTGEVAVASLYRSVGFAGYAETEVPKAGRDFDRQSLLVRPRRTNRSAIGMETWRTVLHGVLESPKQPNQSSKRFLQLCPVVPDVALYSGSARLAGNSWNPGALIQRMVAMGSPSHSEAARQWADIFVALSVTEDDDIWARWLQQEFEMRQRVDCKWQPTALERVGGLPDSEKKLFAFPAKQFVKDLDAILGAKTVMTRRQWVSLLEAIVRLGAVSHVIWLCRVNEKLWSVVATLLGQGEARVPESESDLRAQVLDAETRYLSYGNAAVPTIRDYASAYLTARLGLNLVLWTLQSIGQKVGELHSTQDLWRFIGLVKSRKDDLLATNLIPRLFSLQDEEARTITCKKGIGSNLVEFARHTLGQRQTTNISLRGYDQSYFLKKRGDSRNAPWVLALGPVAVLAMVHCCLRDARGPRSVSRLSDHLGWYGLDVDADDMSATDLGKNLRMLGLVLDSPDAEAGMLLVPPFAAALAKEGA